MIFLLDIGNTRAKTAFFDKALQPQAALSSGWTLKDLQQIWNKYPATGIAVTASGVFPEGVEDWLIKLGAAGTQILFFSHDTPVPVRNGYRTPQTLGKDRLAAVIGTHALYPDSNCLIIDTGTCTTYNLLTATGIFLGGNITPGIPMRLQAMHHFTARLPVVSQQSTDEVLGYDTETSMRFGAQSGAVFEMEGFIKYYRRQFPGLQVILTGGDTAFFYKYLSLKNIRVHEDLVFYGLKEIFYYNFKNNV